MSIEEERISSLHILEPIITIRAALLAREGNFGQSESLLLPFTRMPQTRTDTLDLLAKIYAQQGRIEEAQHLWLIASQKEPSYTGFLRALSHCENIQTIGYRRFLLSRLIGLKVFMILQKMPSLLLRLSKEFHLLLKRLSRDIYLNLREFGLALVETFEVIIGKKSWY